MAKQRIVHADDITPAPREGYSYQRYVAHGDSTPFNFLRIKVRGQHKSRCVIHGIRNYFVVSGSGTFFVEAEQYPVKSNDLVTIHPGERYSYEGNMELIEFNIPTDGQIEHEDLE